MTDESEGGKEWKTTKIPEPTLQDAREYTRAYYELMQDGMRFQQETLERFDRLRDSATGAELDPQNSDAFLNALLDVWEKADMDVVEASALERETGEPLSKEETKQAVKIAMREELPSGVFRQ